MQASAIFTRARDRVGKVREQPRHLRGRLEMALGIDREPEARFRDGAFLADAGEHVGERPALRDVIMHVVDGDERRADARAEFIEQAEPARLVAAIAMHAGEKGAARRRLRERCEPLGESRQTSSSGGMTMSIWPSLAARMSSKVRWHSPFRLLTLRLPSVSRRQSRP